MLPAGLERKVKSWPGRSGFSPSCPQCPGQHKLSGSHQIKPKAAVSPPRSWRGCGQGKAERSHLIFSLSSVLQNCSERLFSLEGVSHGFLKSSRTSTQGFLIDRPLRYYFCNRNFKIFPLMLCRLEKEEL